jgi:hypothetical protein
VDWAGTTLEVPGRWAVEAVASRMDKGPAKPWAATGETRISPGPFIGKAFNLLNGRGFYRFRVTGPLIRTVRCGRAGPGQGRQARRRGDRPWPRCLGVTEFGQSSGLDDAYRLHHIDAGSIVDAALAHIHYSP